MGILREEIHFALHEFGFFAGRSLFLARSWCWSRLTPKSNLRTHSEQVYRKGEVTGCHVLSFTQDKHPAHCTITRPLPLLFLKRLFLCNSHNVSKVWLYKSQMPSN